jgi:hypothetical protein
LTYLLSRYLPAEGELPGALADTGTAYSLVSVAGWLRTFAGAAQRRKRLTMVEAGSLVALPAGPAGRIEDVRPTYTASGREQPGLSHEVWRCGLALGLGWPKGG